MSTSRRKTPGAGVPHRRSRRKTEPPSFPALVPFAQRLEALRFERGLTQRALAERARISTNHYQEIAYGHANPTIIVLSSLADALGVSLVDLFEETPAVSDEYRVVVVEDLEDVVAQHRHLANALKRLTKSVMPRRSRARKRRSLL